MVEYKCLRCGYIAKQRSHLKNHLIRKNICKPILDDISIYSIKGIYGFEITHNNSKLTQNYSKLTQNDCRLTQSNPSEIPQKPSKIPKNPSKIPQNPQNICKYCKKEYSRYDNLKRHYSTCKEKKKSEQIVLYENNKITEMEKEIKELKEIIINQKNTNITNSNNNNTTNINNTNNIIINNLGEENIEYLKSKKFMELLNGIYGAIPKLIEDIHFNPEHPENQNIKYPNKKKPYLKVMKNNKWQYMNKKTEVMDLIDSKCYMLKDKYYSILEKGKYKLSDVQRSRIDSFLSKYDNEDKRVIMDLIDRTELILLNNN